MKDAPACTSGHDLPTTDPGGITSHARCLDAVQQTSAIAADGNNGQSKTSRELGICRKIHVDTVNSYHGTFSAHSIGRLFGQHLLWVSRTSNHITAKALQIG